MIRLTSVVIATAMLIGIAPMAKAVTCRERLDDLSKKVDAVTDAKTKQEAIKEKEKAQEAMAKNDESGCMSHAETGLNMMHGD
jgi:hypothetical protein